MDSYEFIKFLTVSIKGSMDQGSLVEEMTDSATGFYALFDVAGEKVPVIITAKHFAQLTWVATFMLHYKDGEQTVTVPITIPVEWIFLENEDLACCKFEPIAKQFLKITGKKPLYHAISESMIPSEEELEQINVLSEVVMLGYPKDIGSTHHKYPLFKKGYLASLPKDNRENRIGFADLCSIPGYSGAPLILNNSNLKLIGILIKTLDNHGMAIYTPSQCLFELKNLLKSEK